MINKFIIGQRVSFTKIITQEDVEAFAKICGDFNPLHFDSQYAAKTRFSKRIVHGMLTASLISTLVGMYLPGTGAIYLGQDLKFIKPVFIDDTITATAIIIEIDLEKKLLVLKTECTNQNEEIVLVGQAKVRYEPVE